MDCDQLYQKPCKKLSLFREIVVSDATWMGRDTPIKNELTKYSGCKARFASKILMLQGDSPLKCAIEALITHPVHTPWVSKQKAAIKATLQEVIVAITLTLTLTPTSTLTLILTLILIEVKGIVQKQERWEGVQLTTRVLEPALNVLRLATAMMQSMGPHLGRCIYVWNVLSAGQTLP